LRYTEIERSAIGRDDRADGAQRLDQSSTDLAGNSGQQNAHRNASQRRSRVATAPGRAPPITA
jgi:hypothetical protein